MRLRLTWLLVAAGLWLSACAPASSPAAPPTTAPAAAAAAAGQPNIATEAAAAPAAKPPGAAAAAQPTNASGAAPGAQPTSAAAAAAKPAATTAPAAPAVSGPPVALHVSYSNLIADNLPEWLAYESGIFKQNGLDVKLDNIASSTGIPAVISGDVQIAHLGGSETLSAAAGGADLVILAITGPVYPFVFMAPAAITGTDQLKGKKIGVSNIGSSSDIATRVMLKKVGLDADKDVSIVAVGSLQNRMAALLSGAIDGGVAQPPDQIALEDKGFHVIYDLAAQKLPSVGDCIVVNRQWMNAHKDVMQRYMDSIVQAIALSKKNKEQSLPVLGKYLQNDDQRALGVTYDFFVGTVTPDYPVVNAALFSDAVEQLSAQNDKIKSFDLNSMLDNEFVQSAQQRKVGP
jgi:NitT/TauT family transport system substrate-binding protein